MQIGFLRELVSRGNTLAKRVEEGVPHGHRDPSAIRLAGGIVVGVLSLALAACQQGGMPAGSAMARPTIVSLNPCSDAILARVAAPGQLLAISHYSHDSASSSMGVAAASHYPSVSGSVEEIARLAPDVVVADTFLAPATRQALRGLGIRVVTISGIDTVDAGKAQVRALAAAAKNVKAGEMLVDDIEHALASSAPATGSAPLSAVVWESGGIVAGDHTLIADLLRHTGFVNAAAVRGMGQADYLPLEAMLTDPPRVILASGSTFSQEDRLLSHPALAALKGTRRVALEGALLWCGGPTIVRAAAELGRLHRELTPPRAAAGRT
jgi:iron complex transport system substrate-binding protein